MEILEKIIIEKETVSDTDYKVTEIFFESGSKINEGDIIASFETSKADIDVECPTDGLIIHNFNYDTKLIPGEVIAIIIDSGSTEDITKLKLKYFSPNNNQNNSIINHKVSKKALELMQRHKLSPADFKSKEVIKLSDVESYIKLKERSTKKNIDLSFIGKPQENDILIIGGRGGAKMIIDAIRSRSEWNIKGIIDSALIPGETILGVEVLGDEDLLADLKLKGFKKIVLSFSNLQDLKSRNVVYQRMKANGFIFPNIIHNNAVIEESAVLGEGNIVLAMAMVGSEATLGNINYVNTGALLCHDAKIGDNNHFAPNSVVAGRVKVEDNILFGMCVTTFYDINIGSNSILNNGVSVIRDLPPNTILKAK